MKNLLVLLLLACFACGDDVKVCTKPGYSGQNCELQLTPKKIELTKVSITKMPAKDSNGNNWDLVGWPDVLPVITTPSGTLVWSSPFYAEDADPSKSIDFVVGPSVDLAGQIFLDIELLDVDGANDYEQMGLKTINMGVTGAIKDFPNPIVVETGTVTFKLYVTYTH